MGAAASPCRKHMVGCQNYGPFLGTPNIRGRIIVGMYYIGDYRDGGFPKLGVPTIMENQMEKNMENEMETEVI